MPHILASLWLRAISSISWILRLVLKVQFNSYPVREFMEIRGIGLFPEAAYATHSCEPNCITMALPDSSGLVLRAIQDITNNTVITISYISSYLSNIQVRIIAVSIRFSKKEKKKRMKFLFWGGHFVNHIS